MPPGVPGERRDAIAKTVTFALQALRNFERACTDAGIGGTMHRAFDRARHHLARAMLDRRMVDDAMAEERPILHQSKHGASSHGLSQAGNSGRWFAKLLP